MSRFPRLSHVAAAALLCAAGSAAAKVAFTGYGDFRLTPESVYTLDIPASFPLPAGTPVGRLEARGAAFDAVGMFATSSLSDDMDFLLDLTYRDIGYTAKTLRIQYAFLEYRPAPATTLRAGKVTLPFGYLNQNLFYPFQHPAVTSPVFASNFLGLPIADLGVTVRQNVTTGPVTTRLIGYVVNGYGPVPGSRTSFRNLALPGGLTMAGNLGSGNANKKPAGGGRLAVFPTSEPASEAGVSLYAGHWDAAGKRMLVMANAHARAVVGRVTVLGEYLHLDVEDDQGFKATMGGADWHTDGFFSTLEVGGPVLFGKGPVTPWVRYEQYRSRATGGTGRERLTGAAGGAGWQMQEHVSLKLEASWLDYRVPAGTGDLSIRGMSYVAGLSVTY